jgi:hypothetical protein
MDSSLGNESLDLSRKIPISHYNLSTPLSSFKRITRLKSDSIINLVPVGNQSKYEKSPDIRRRRISMQIKLKALNRKSIVDSPKKKVNIY